jgi:hypothetical protein
MKIYGLIDLKNLFIFNSFKINFENVVNASYKMSEDGAQGIVIKGKFADALKVQSYLDGKIDISIGILIGNVVEYEKALDKGIDLIFSQKKFPKANEVLIPLNKKFLALNGKCILLENRRLLTIFKETVDFLPEIVSVVSFRLSQLNYDCFITEEVRSAKRGLEVSKYI